MRLRSSVVWGLHSWLGGKEPACRGRRHERCGLDLWVGKIPRSRKWLPLQYSFWKIPWTEETGGLQSMGSPRVGHDWAHKGRLQGMLPRLWPCQSGACSSAGPKDGALPDSAVKLPLLWVCTAQRLSIRGPSAARSLVVVRWVRGPCPSAPWAAGPAALAAALNEPLPSPDAVELPLKASRAQHLHVSPGVTWRLQVASCPHVPSSVDVPEMKPAGLCRQLRLWGRACAEQTGGRVCASERSRNKRFLLS